DTYGVTKILNVNIRPAQLEDLDTLLAFEQGVIASERPFDQSLKEENITYYNLEKLITNENSHLIVAEYDGALIASGYALIMNSRPFEKHEYFSYLGFMFVVPEYRRKGLNKKIIGSLIDWSKRKGIAEVRLDVFDQNESALLAYEKLGFNKTLVKMRLDIS
ncbi:MAG: ribosomal protein S18 acetylase RimI-like enzyme, partial [Colwellia sp.]